MKKLVLFAALLVLGATSCSKDDDNNQSAELAGKWEFAQEGSILMGQEVLTPYEHEEGCAKDFVMITSNTVAEHTFNGSNCIEDIDIESYTRNGNILTSVVDGQTITLEIVSLNNEFLKVKRTENYAGQTFVFVSVFVRK